MPITVRGRVTVATRTLTVVLIGKPVAQAVESRRAVLAVLCPVTRATQWPAEVRICDERTSGGHAMAGEAAARLALGILFG